MEYKNSIIDIKNLSYRYEKEYVLKNINFSLQKGSFLGIVGPNGSGKSTLLKLILGLLNNQQGEIKIFDQEISKFKEWEKIGFVSQKANSFNTGFPATVYEVVKSGLTKKLGFFRYMKKEHHEKVLKAIESVGLLSLRRQNIGELSGGQQQRVFIARALVSEPQILILDEPTVGVDTENVQSFYEMLGELNKEMGITLMLVTHDVGAITDKVTHVACLNKQLFFHGNTNEYKELSQHGMNQLYGYDLQLLHHDHTDDNDTNNGGSF